MKASVLALALVVLGLSNVAKASTVPESPVITAINAELSKCIDEDNSNYGMKICISAAYDKADAELNRVYKIVKASTSGVERERLVTAQRAWIKFRDAEADYAAASMLGGTGEGLMYMDNILSITSARVNDFTQTISINEQR
jgi:uncharacterized protein YecT (DUF1311 family)